MTDILTDGSPERLAAATEDNGFGCIRLWARWHRMTLRQDTCLTWTESDIAFPFFNNVLGGDIAEDRVDPVIRQVQDRVAPRNLPMFWWTGTRTRPLGLGSALLARGFTHLFTAPAMAIDLEHAEARAKLDSPAASFPEEVTLEQVLDFAHLREWCQVMGEVYEFPSFAIEAWTDMLQSVSLGQDHPYRHFSARRDRRVVATSSLFLGAGVVGISSVATLPTVQRQGIGTAVTWEALRAAHRLGYRYGVLFSSEQGLKVYQRMGFREVSSGNCYFWQKDTPKTTSSNSRA